MNFNQSSNVPYLTEKQKELLKKLPDNITLIMIGCDTEFLQNKENAIEVLNFLSELKRDISLITKLPISDNFIDELVKINEIIKKNGNSLTLSISITSTKSSKILEPNVPSPQKRIDTLKRSYEAGLITMVAIRPLIPIVSDDELEEIISETKEYCIGYYSGHLYLKDITDPNNFELLKNSEIESQKLQPHWMPNGNEFELVKKNGQMEKLKELLEKYKKPIFEGAAEGVAYIKEHNL